MASRRLSSSPWLAPTPRKAMPSGRRAGWPAGPSSWRLSRRSRNRPCVGYSKKRAQTVAEAVVVYPESDRRVRGPYGGCSRVVRRAAGRLAACGLPGRVEQGTAWPGGRPDPGRARATGQGGLRVQAAGDGELVRAAVPPLGLAAPGGDGATGLPRVRPPDESAGRCLLPGGGGGPSGAGQPEHARVGSVVRDVWAGGGAADREATGVPLHAQARQLAEHGGDGIQCLGSPVPGSAHRFGGRPGAGGGDVGSRTEPGPDEDPVDLPRRRRTQEAPLGLSVITCGVTH